jgi:hypothetical protein
MIMSTLLIAVARKIDMIPRQMGDGGQLLT